MRKSTTLIELLIAVSLLSVVILAAATFDIASRNFLRASQRKAEVVNDATLVLDHMHKNILSAIGDIHNFTITPVGGGGFGSNGVQFIRDSNNDAMLNGINGPDRIDQYLFDPSIGHSIDFLPAQGLGGLPTVNLTRRLVPNPGGADQVTIISDIVHGTVVPIGVRVNFILRWDPDPAEPRHAFNNPEVHIAEQFFFPLSYSLQ